MRLDLKHFVGFEKEGNLTRRGLRAVGAMDGVLLDILAAILTDSSRRGFGRVGRPHDFAVFEIAFSPCKTDTKIGPEDI